MAAYLEKRLLRREEKGNLRELQNVKHLIDFASNDYLGLAQSQELEDLIKQELAQMRCNLGSTGSRLLTGNSEYAQELESSIARFHGHDSALIFNCGYMANLGLLSAIAGDDNIVFYDSGVHASIHAGMRMSRIKALPFRHNNLNHLEHRLSNCHDKGERFICVESIYSTDGSQAPLTEICQLATKYRAHVIVDEAHAIGVEGPEGRGLVAKYNLEQQVFAVVVTFGKALGSFGAAILGKRILQKGLINFASSFIYTTALPLHALAAIKCSYEIFPKLESQRQHLKRLVGICTEAISPSSTHIQPVIKKGNVVVKEFSAKLREKNFDVRALTSPTVKQGCETLRICLHALNTEEELKQLLELLN